MPAPPGKGPRAMSGEARPRDLAGHNPGDGHSEIVPPSEEIATAAWSEQNRGSPEMLSGRHEITCANSLFVTLSMCQLCSSIRRGTSVV